MSPVHQSIARENFRSSGYVSRIDDTRRPAFGFVRRRLRPAFNPDIVHDALQRRERARQRLLGGASLIRGLFDALRRK